MSEEVDEGRQFINELTARIDTEIELEDARAFERLVVQRMQWAPGSTGSLQTQVIANARRAWNEALKWERRNK